MWYDISLKFPSGGTNDNTLSLCNPNKTSNIDSPSFQSSHVNYEVKEYNYRDI